MAQQKADIAVTNAGTIFLFEPLTKSGRAWISSNVGDESTWFGSSLVVEHRYARDLAQGMQADGLVLR